MIALHGDPRDRRACGRTCSERACTIDERILESAQVAGARCLGGWVFTCPVDGPLAADEVWIA